jgi:thioredoxin 1
MINPSSIIKQRLSVFRLLNRSARLASISSTLSLQAHSSGTSPASSSSFSTASSSSSSSSATFSTSTSTTPPPFHTLEEDKLDLKKLLDNHASGKAILYFTASWCGPCKAIAPTFSSIAAANADAKILFVKIDVDDNAAAAEQHAIRAVPTFMSLSGGKVIKTFSGANVEALKTAVAELAAKA